jgi:hypothetical protein
MFLAREDDYSCGYGAASPELKTILYKDGNYKNVLTLKTDNMRNIPMKLTQGKEFRCCYYVVIDGRWTFFRCLEACGKNGGGCYRHGEGKKAEIVSAGLISVFHKHKNDTVIEDEYLEFPIYPDDEEEDEDVDDVLDDVRDGATVEELDISETIEDDVLQSQLDRFKVFVGDGTSAVHAKRSGVQFSSSELAALGSTDWAEALKVDPAAAFVINCFPTRYKSHWLSPTHENVKKLLTKIVTCVDSTVIFGCKAEIQLVTILPNITLLKKKDPYSQLKELLFLVADFDDNFEKEKLQKWSDSLKLQTWSEDGANATEKTITSVDEAITAIAQKLASVLFNGITERIQSHMSEHPQGFFGCSVPYPRPMLLLHGSGFGNIMGFEKAIAESDVSLPGLNSALMIKNQNTVWSYFANIAQGLDQFLKPMDDGIEHAYNNAWNRAAQVSVFEKEQMSFFVNLLQNLSREAAPTSGRGTKRAASPRKRLGVLNFSSVGLNKKKMKKKGSSKSGDGSSSSQGDGSGSGVEPKPSLEEQHQIAAEFQSKQAKKYEGGIYGLENNIMHAIVANKGDDKDYFKKMQAPASGGRDTLQKIWSVVANDENLLYKDIKGNNKTGLDFSKFISFEWNRINPNHLEVADTALNTAHEYICTSSRLVDHAETGEDDEAFECHLYGFCSSERSL